MGTTTSHCNKVAAIRKNMLAEIKTLQTAVKDDNALMAGNDILRALQELETLRNTYAEAAWDAHTAFIATMEVK